MYIASLERFHIRNYPNIVHERERWTQLSAALGTAKQMFLENPDDNACRNYTSCAQVRLASEDIIDRYRLDHSTWMARATNKVLWREREVEQKLDEAMKDLLHFILVNDR